MGAGIQDAAAINVNPAFNPSKITLILPKKGKISITDPMKSLSEGVVQATGVFAIQQDFDNKYAITNLDFVKQQLGLGVDEYSAVEIKLAANYNIDAAQLHLAALLGKNYLVQTKYEQNTSLYSTMKFEKWAIYAVLTLILFIAAFNMVSSLTMLVLEKQKDISVLQSMGANKNMILKIFFSEGLLLAGIGGVIGILLALLICFLQIKLKFIKLQGGSFLIDYFPVNLQLSDFILVTLTASIIAILAAWLPANKAARQIIELK